MNSNRTSTLVLVALVLAIVIGALWLPFEINRLDMSDTYGNMMRISSGLYQEGLIGILNLKAESRHFSYIPMGIGYLLTPMSLVGQQIVLMATLWFKAFVGFLVIRRLVPTLSIVFAVLAGVMITIYPGDNDYYYFTVIHNHFSIASLFIAAYLFIISNEIQGRRIVVIGVLTTIFITFGVTFNEAVHPFMFGIPIILFIWFRWRFTRSRMIFLGIWYVTELIWAVDYFFALQTGAARYSDAVSLSGERILKAIEGIGRAGSYLFTNSWSELSVGGLELWFVAIIAGFAFAILVRQTQANGGRLTRKEYGGLLGLGVAFIVFGYLPFSITPRNFTYNHTLLLSMIGAGLILTTVLHFVSQILGNRKQLVILLTSVAVAITVRGALGTHQRYLDDIRRGQDNIWTIVNTVPSFKNGAGFLLFILGDSHTRPRPWEDDVLGPRLFVKHIWRLHTPLRYIYNSRLPFCVHFVDSNDELAGCTIGTDFFTVENFRATPFSQAIAFEFDTQTHQVRFLEEIPSGYLPDSVNTSAYNPLSQINNCVSPTSRVDDIFGMTPLCPN